MTEREYIENILKRLDTQKGFDIVSNTKHEIEIRSVYGISIEFDDDGNVIDIYSYE